MIGRLVRHRFTDKVGIVLSREVTRKGNFRYRVFLGGEVLSLLPCWLEVIDE